MFTRNEWKGSFTSCCTPGDEVDEDIVDHFLNCLPPKVWHRHYFLQAGEEHDHTEHGPTYITFEKRDEKWYYLGTCLKNMKEHIS